MKKMLLALIAAITTVSATAQDTTAHPRPMGLYTFFVNIIPGDYYFPLIGFINQAQGDHTSLQAGFMNTAQKNLTGAQLGFINLTGKTVTGIQAGFINTCGDSLTGTQAGFVNTLKGNATGTQLGFVNIAGDSLCGLQAGFINTGTQKTVGAQAGFINITRHLQGLQAGFANTTAVAEGTQIGFVNSARKVKGFQLGFINVADTVEAGMPFGFLSFIKKGGYSSLEAGVSEMFPVNLSFRVGMHKLYTVIMAAYNTRHPNPFAVGGGIGAIFMLGDRFYLNPEAVSQNNIGDFAQQTISFTPYTGFVVTKKLHLVAGPSVVWNCIDEGSDFYDPLFSFSRNGIDNRNRILTGARFGLRYNLNW